MPAQTIAPPVINLAQIVYTTATPCPSCDCDPDRPWYCGCSNPWCPCSEEG